MARFLGADRDEAEAVVADLLVDAAFDSRNESDDEIRRALSCRLYLTCARLRLSRQARPGTAPHEAEDEAPETLPVRVESTALTDRQRAVLALCWFGDHTYRDAADAMSLSVPDVLDLMRSGLRGLAGT